MKVSLISRIDDKVYDVYIAGESFYFFKEFNTWYCLEKNKNWDYIWDYFYTSQEVRKMKLNKIGL